MMIIHSGGPVINEHKLPMDGFFHGWLSWPDSDSDYGTYRGIRENNNYIPSGKHTEHYGKSPFSMAKSTISMAMFNSFLYVYQAG